MPRFSIPASTAHSASLDGVASSGGGGWPGTRFDPRQRLCLSSSGQLWLWGHARTSCAFPWHGASVL